MQKPQQQNETIIIIIISKNRRMTPKLLMKLHVVQIIIIIIIISVVLHTKIPMIKIEVSFLHQITLKLVFNEIIIKNNKITIAMTIINKKIVEAVVLQSHHWLMATKDPEQQRLIGRRMKIIINRIKLKVRKIIFRRILLLLLEFLVMLAISISLQILHHHLHHSPQVEIKLFRKKRRIVKLKTSPNKKKSATILILIVILITTSFLLHQRN